MSGDPGSKPRSLVARVARLLAGSVAAQLIPLASLPILTRLYRPGDFSDFMIVYGTGVTLYIVLTLRLDAAFLIDGDDRRAAGLFRLLFRVTLVLSIPMALGLSVGRLGGINNPLVWWAAIWGFSIFQLSILWCLRRAGYWAMSGIRVSNAVIFVLVSILLGYLGFGFGLIAGLIAGNMITAVIALTLTGATAEAWQAISRQRIRELLNLHKAFPLKDMPAGLISSLTIYLPNIVLAHWLGDVASGYYAFCQRLVQAPSATISMACGEVFKREAAQVSNETGTFYPVLKWFLVVMTAGAIGMLLAVQFLSKDVIGYVFGAEWRDAASLVKVLTIRYSIAFVAAPLGFALIIAGKQGVNLIWQVANLALTLASLAVGSAMHSLSAFAWTYALGGLALYAIYLRLSVSVARTDMKVRLGLRSP